MESDSPKPDNEQQEQAAEQSPSSSQYAPDELGKEEQAAKAARPDVNLDLVLDIPVEVSLRVGATEISIRDLVSLVEGSVIAMDRDADAPLDVLVNGTLIAHGEIVIVDDQYGVRLTDVVTPVERIEKLH